MKRIPARLWLTLAAASSPLLHAQQPAPAAAAPATANSDAEAFAGLQQHLEKINRSIQEARAEATEMAGQRDAARKETAAVRDEKQKLEKQLTGVQQQLTSTSREVTQWRDKAGALEKKLGAGEEAYAKLAGFRDQMDATMKEFATLKSGLAEIRGELDAPTERVALRKEIETLKGGQEQLAKRHEEEVQAHGKTKSQLATTDSALQSLKATFAKLSTDAKARTEELAKLTREREELAGKLAESEKQIASHRTEEATLKQASAALEKSLASARAEADGLKKVTSTLAAERNNARGELAALQKEAAELRASAAPLTEELQASKEQTELAVAAIREANVSRQRAEEARSAIQKELDSLKGELAAAVANRDTLKQQVTVKTNEIESLRKTVEELNTRTADKDADKEHSAGL